MLDLHLIHSTLSVDLGLQTLIRLPEVGLPPYTHHFRLLLLNYSRHTFVDLIDIELYRYETGSPVKCNSK